jgi:hypothetical protein
MAWDLRGALLKKAEVESARLADFDFRLRVRTARLLVAQFGLDPGEWAQAAAAQTAPDLLMALAERSGADATDLVRRHAACEAEARRTLVAEIGDPAPHRLA